MNSAHQRIKRATDRIAHSKLDDKFSWFWKLMRRRIPEIGSVSISKGPIPFCQLNGIVETIQCINRCVYELYRLIITSIQFRPCGIPWINISKEKIEISE